MSKYRTFLTIHPSDDSDVREAVLTDLLELYKQSKRKCADKIIRMIEDLRLYGQECRYIKTFKDSSIFELKDRTPEGGARVYCFRVSRHDFAIARAECKNEDKANLHLIQWTEDVIKAWQQGQDVLRPKPKPESKTKQSKKK
jgi:hypothetical protein